MSVSLRQKDRPRPPMIWACGGKTAVAHNKSGRVRRFRSRQRESPRRCRD
ncbi:hypothetical protein I553_3889 [Mycobacterium xenopi 4042]|uniref:Uncharacterized protein n=1 Tax=Mycobacterium xenopi 4042 TaxID=1299334 RepID=X8DB66_MYCXE|nr:hypothetical protein I553_3889 [Mycobacterium xenopi 4042]